MINGTDTHNVPTSENPLGPMVYASVKRGDHVMCKQYRLNTLK